MAISHIHTYLVHPGKGQANAPQVGGTTVPLDGKLFRLLENIYARSDEECDIEISFNADAEGRQENPCRSLLTTYLGGPTLVRGRTIAMRLQEKTDKRSGLGLLFLIAGKEGHHHKIVISRFPTDSAILAEENQANLTVEFLERVFMKSATSYKAAMYQDTSLLAGFWQGRAVDKQINSRISEVSNYWIEDFLDSEFLLTAAAGTRRLGVALRNAAKLAEDLDVKQEITAAVTLARSLRNKRISIRDFEEQFGLSDEAREAIESQLPKAELAEEKFKFDFDEFSGEVGYRSVQLNNGGLLTAESAEFDDVFQREVVDQAKNEVRYSTQGKVVNEKLRKAHE